MNRKIRCIITDDEPVAREGLADYAGRIDFLETVALCEDAIELGRMMHHSPVDLLFLDIQMPEITGIDFLQSLAHPPKVVFTTAFEEYALQGFELDVLDYLKKPISFNRFKKAANKALDYFELLEGKEPESLFVKTNGRMEKVHFSDILFVQAMQNYLLIHTDRQRLMVHGTIKSFLEKLPAGFIQIHRSYIIAVNKVSAIEGGIITIAGCQLPMSRVLKESVIEQIIGGSPTKGC